MFIKRTQAEWFFTPGASPVRCECDKTFWWQWDHLPWLSSWSISLEKIILCCSFKILLWVILKRFFQCTGDTLLQIWLFGRFVLRLGMLCLNIYKMTNAFAFSCRISTFGIYFVSSRLCIWNNIFSIVCSDKGKTCLKKKTQCNNSRTLCQKNIYFCFTDYAKAFDCVDHNKLWKILKEVGIPDHLTCLVRNLYAGQEATVRTGHGTTDWFQIGKGVHQRLYIVTLLI